MLCWVCGGPSTPLPEQDRDREGGPTLCPRLGSLARPPAGHTISLSYSHRVLQGVLNLRLSQEHVPSAHTPQHAFESGDAFSVDHASHKAAGRADGGCPTARGGARHGKRSREESQPAAAGQASRGTPASLPPGPHRAYPSRNGAPLPISLGSRSDEDSSNRSGSAIC